MQIASVQLPISIGPPMMALILVTDIRFQVIAIQICIILTLAIAVSAQSSRQIRICTIVRLPDSFAVNKSSTSAAERSDH